MVLFAVILCLWVALLLTIVHLDGGAFYAFWSEPHPFGWPVWQMAIAVLALTLAGLAVLVPAGWRAQRRPPKVVLSVLLVALVVGGGWINGLLYLGRTRLDYGRQQAAIRTESFDDYRTHLARVDAVSPCPTCPEGRRRAVVMLDTCEPLKLTAPVTESDLGRLVEIEHQRGRYSGTSRYELRDWVEMDDAVLFFSTYTGCRDWKRSP